MALYISFFIAPLSRPMLIRYCTAQHKSLSVNKNLVAFFIVTIPVYYNFMTRFYVGMQLTSRLFFNAANFSLVNLVLFSHLCHFYFSSYEIFIFLEPDLLTFFQELSWIIFLLWIGNSFAHFFPPLMNSIFSN